MEQEIIYLTREEEEFLNIRFLKRYLLGTNGYVAGGCFKNIFKGEKVKDIDVFFRCEEDFREAANKYRTDTKFRLKYKNKNVVAYTDVETGVVVELVKRTFAEPHELLEMFDFSITKFAYFFTVDYDEEERIYEYQVVHHEKFFEHLLANRLVIDSSELLYPFSTFERSYKYSRYGYSMCRESKVHLIEAIKNNEFKTEDLSTSMYASSGID